MYGSITYMKLKAEFPRLKAKSSVTIQDRWKATITKISRGYCTTQELITWKKQKTNKQNHFLL